jgi:hypothetical protein
LEKNIIKRQLSKENKAMMSNFIIAVFVLLPFFDIDAQTMITGSDTLKLDYTNPAIKNPKTATILSAMMPGAGQVYNGKPWKVPLIYAGFAANIYFIEFNNRRYKIFRDALFAFDKPGGSTDASRPFPSLNRDALVRNVNFWRRNRDLNYFLFIGIYALNIIDANVDAHLSAFDVSDDLTFRIEPSYESLSAGGGNIMGISLKINF